MNKNLLFTFLCVLRESLEKDSCTRCATTSKRARVPFGRLARNESIGAITQSGTTFYNASARNQTQTTNTITLGTFLSGISYENDTEMPDLSGVGVPRADGGDRYRTAALQMYAGSIEVGMLLHTGEPGHDRPQVGNIPGDFANINGINTYEGGTINDLNQRMGAVYLGVGPLRLGWDAEGIRHFFQNRIAHDRLFSMRGQGWPWVRTFRGQNNFYWYYGTGNGNTLW